jgi:hypothetical protein
MRMRTEVKPRGRPRRDPRGFAILEFLAERRDGVVTNAEVRAHLDRLGHGSDVQFVGRTLATLAHEKVLTRLSMGRYRIEGSHPRLQSIRWRAAFAAKAEAAKLETARLMARHEEPEREKRS